MHLETHYQYIELWTGLYSGYSPYIHDYKVFNSLTKQHKQCKMPSLMMPWRIATDWAGLIVSEKLDVSLTVGNEETSLGKSFNGKFARFVEQYFATGQGIIIPYRDKNENVDFNFYTGNEFEVLEWHGETPTAYAIYCKDYTMLVIDYGNYTEIEYEKKDKYKDVELPEPYRIKHFPKYYRPNIANNQTLTNHGISIYANAVHVLKEIDKRFSDLSTEFRNSIKKQFISRHMLLSEEVTEAGEKTTFYNYDTDEYMYQMLDGEEDRDFFKEYTPEIRVEAYHKDINFLLSQLGSLCGLEEDFYKFENNNVSSRKTEREIVSEDSGLFRSKKRHEQIIEENLPYDIANLYSLMKQELDIDLISIKFDDSLITDDRTAKLDAQAEVKSGLMSLKRYLIDFGGFQDGSAELEAELQLLSTVPDFPQG